MLPNRMVILVGLSVGVLVLSGCSKAQLAASAGPLCKNSAATAAKAYSGATTKTGQAIAEKAVDAAILTGETVASLISNGHSDTASNIHDILAKLRARKTASNLTGKSVSALHSQRAKVASALTDLGSLCANIAVTITKDNQKVKKDATPTPKATPKKDTKKK